MVISPFCILPNVTALPNVVPTVVLVLMLLFALVSARGVVELLFGLRFAQAVTKTMPHRALNNKLANCRRISMVGGD